MLDNKSSMCLTLISWSCDKYPSAGEHANVPVSQSVSQPSFQKRKFFGWCCPNHCFLSSSYIALLLLLLLLVHSNTNLYNVVPCPDSISLRTAAFCSTMTRSSALLFQIRPTPPLTKGSRNFWRHRILYLNLNYCKMHWMTSTSVGRTRKRRIFPFLLWYRCWARQRRKFPSKT